MIGDVDVFSVNGISTTKFTVCFEGSVCNNEKQKVLSLLPELTSEITLQLKDENLILKNVIPHIVFN